MTDPDLVDHIIAVLAAEAGLKKPADLLKRTARIHRICKFRDDAIYLARQLTSMSYPELAQRFGERHHTTLICAVRKVELRLRNNPIRKDGRTWADWHKYLVGKIQADATALTGVNQ